MTMAPSPAMEWIDSHCHFDSFVEEGTERAVLDRAVAAGLTLVVAIGGSPAANERTRSLAQTYPGLVVGTVGYDRDLANDAPSLASLAAQARLDGVVAIGETGLDYHYDYAPRDVQADVFRKHIDAARRTGLPLVIHSREAEDDTASILEDEMGKGAFTAVLHCFSSKPELAWRGIDIGLYVSFSGIVTFKKSEDFRELAAKLPADRILVETDAPYLAPVPNRGKRNEPAYVADTARVVADARGIGLADLAELTTANALRLFNRFPAEAVGSVEGTAGL